ALLAEIKEQKGKIDEEHREQEASRTAMRECYRDCKDPRKLRKNITAMYHELILEENKRGKEADGVEEESRTDDAEGDDVDAYQKEFNRQRDYLEKCMMTLKQKHEKAAHVHRSTNTRVLQDNVTLIREINNLRREVSFLKNERAAEERISSAASTVNSESTSRDSEKEAEMQQKVGLGPLVMERFVALDSN
ncbi:hypothetical protein FOZ62_002467, partial [Perkinsus olseni]